MAEITRRTLVTAGALAAALGFGVTGVVLADDDGTRDSDDTNDQTDDDTNDDTYDDDGYGATSDGYGGSADGSATPVAGAGYDLPRTGAS